MKLAVIAPEAAGTYPIIYWLSGLTCTEENFIQKAGAARAAMQHGVAIVCPDTSPRGLGIPGEDDSYDFGSGAGFYLNATVDKWKPYQMYDYVTKELPSAAMAALTIALKNPGFYKSVSAFAPICNPMNCPWGEKAFTGYLGEDKEAWKEYDATELIKAGKGKAAFPDILIDCGTSDNFYTDKQLLPENFEGACKEAGQKVTLRMQPGYDHSYFFISTFIDEHVAFHKAQF
eukprot:CAMPEP_0114565802 /NCGR_PEP_ID=MMETSP0114-20121206/14518_1 /TAXON_ID=31324 /ORGANISM="Goniomonas sp, Strain m" /LENGTH=230 /DNA_ID=CAMNT_0001752101 /DNA_START=46 /DNA_END=737 /DNA_ORIENTATION=+